MRSNSLNFGGKILNTIFFLATVFLSFKVLKAPLNFSCRREPFGGFPAAEELGDFPNQLRLVRKAPITAVTFDCMDWFQALRAHGFIYFFLFNFRFFTFIWRFIFFFWRRSVFLGPHHLCIRSESFINNLCYAAQFTGLDLKSFAVQFTAGLVLIQPCCWFLP